MTWDALRWPHFTAREIACPCCGEAHFWPVALENFDRKGKPIDPDTLQASIFKALTAMGYKVDACKVMGWNWNDLPPAPPKTA